MGNLSVFSLIHTNRVTYLKIASLKVLLKNCFFQKFLTFFLFYFTQRFLLYFIYFHIIFDIQMNLFIRMVEWIVLIILMLGVLIVTSLQRNFFFVLILLKLWMFKTSGVVQVLIVVKLVVSPRDYTDSSIAELRETNFGGSIQTWVFLAKIFMMRVLCLLLTTFLNFRVNFVNIITKVNMSMRF